MGNRSINVASVLKGRITHLAEKLDLFRKFLGIFSALAHQ
jgi:hypothetical protein